MSTGNKEKSLSPHFIMNENVMNSGREIYRTIIGSLMESDGRVSVETLLATTAAITGEAAAFASLSNPEMTRGIVSDSAIEFLESLSEIIKSQFVSHQVKIEYPDFDDLVQQSCAGNGLVLTNDPYYEPHQRPVCAAAIYRNAVQAITKKHKIGEWEVASAAAFAVINAAEQALQIDPPDVIYRLVMETAIGVAQSKPIVVQDARMINDYDKLLKPESAAISASKEIFGLLLRTSAEAAKGTCDNKEDYTREGILTAIAMAGALTGEMALRAGKKTISSSPAIIMCAKTDAFLARSYREFVLFAGHPNKRSETLPRFQTHLTHAIKSFGADPYPNLTLDKKDQPKTWPPYAAAIIRDDISTIAKKHALDSWSLASACTFAGLNIINADHKAVVSRTIAARLFIEEALGMAHITPIDLNALRDQADPDMQRSMDSLALRLRPSPRAPNGPN
ncbi:MAG: hypothetical protein KGI37_00625 [Alphaproteobacteria bacterium]|nr:hypothetical protein [Alphaproteobacteria bacterium]